MNIEIEGILAPGHFLLCIALAACASDDLGATSAPSTRDGSVGGGGSASTDGGDERDGAPSSSGGRPDAGGSTGGFKATGGSGSGATGGVEEPPDGSVVLGDECRRLQEELMALDGPRTCETDLDCHLFGEYIVPTYGAEVSGAFVSEEDVEIAEAIVVTLETECDLYSCGLDGPSNRGRCRSGSCERIEYGCNYSVSAFIFHDDAGACGDPPSEPLELVNPHADPYEQQVSYEEFETAVCLLNECWPGSYTYAIGFGVTRKVEPMRGDGGDCTFVITEYDDDGWGQKKVCPAWEPQLYATFDYFTTLEPSVCAVTPL